MRVTRNILLPVLCLCSCLAFAQNSSHLTLLGFEALGVPVYEGNEVRLLTVGEEKFEDMFQKMRSAKRFIHLDYFKFQEDGICNSLFTILQQKAAEGVEVRVLYDSYCNGSSAKPLSKEFVKRMTDSGIEIHPFSVVRFPWVNYLLHRDHHKIAVIDGEYVYSGGMNVADYYLYGHPQVGEWRDMHFVAEGGVADGYEATFETMWEKTTGEKLDTEKYKSAGRKTGGCRIAYVDRMPVKSPRLMRQAYCLAIDNAREMIQIVNPYAMLFGMVRRSLYKALKRGVRVQFMSSTNTDGPLNSDLIGKEMKTLMDRGAEVYYYEGGFHHSKYMVVDSTFCTIGTANLDGRSLNCDYEVNAFIFDPKVARELQAVFDRDKAQKCTLLTPEEWKARFPLKRRIKARMLGIIKRAM